MRPTPCSPCHSPTAWGLKQKKTGSHHSAAMISDAGKGRWFPSLSSINNRRKRKDGGIKNKEKERSFRGGGIVPTKPWGT